MPGPRGGLYGPFERAGGWFARQLDILRDLILLHQEDPAGAHEAAAVAVTPAGGLAATNAQAALVELAADVTAEATARVAADALLIPLTQKAAANGVATLGADSKIPGAQLPALAIGETFTVASQAAMLALTAQRGDIAVRTDLNPDGFFLLTSDSPATLADWVQVTAPGAVVSVNGQTGAVDLSGTYPENPLDPTPATAHVVGGPDVPVADGGTGASSASTARTNLGAAADAEVVKLTGDQAVTGTKDLSGGRLVLPGSTTAALPAAGTAGRVARVSDGVRGVWVDTGSFWVPVNAAARVRLFDAAGDGVADDTTKLDNAQLSLPATGGVVELDAGTYGVAGAATASIILKRGLTTFKGAGMYATTIKRLSGTLPLVRTSGATGYLGVTFEDICFDWNAGTTYNPWDGVGRVLADFFGNGVQRVTFRRCRFLNPPETIIQTQGAHDLTVEDCVVDSPGNFRGRFVVAHTGARRVRVRRNRLRYCRDGVILTTTTNAVMDDCVIEDNHMDFGWYTGVGMVTGSGGTVSYVGSATVNASRLQDTSKDFSTLGLDTGGGETGNTVRVLYSLASGSGAPVTYTTTETSLTDTGKDFNALGVKEGMYIRAGTAFAIVAAVKSATVVWVEEWLSDANRLPVAAPAAGTAYTLYDVVLGRIQALRTTTNPNDTLDISFWKDLTGTALLTGSAKLAAGLGYEILPSHPNYPIQGSSATEDIEVIGNTIKRPYSDAIAAFGKRWRIRQNSIEWTHTFGSDLEGDQHEYTENTLRRCGGGGAFLGAGTHKLANNRMMDNVWVNDGGTPTDQGDIIIVGGTNHHLSSNTTERLDTSITIAHHGIIAIGGSGHRVSDHSSRGHVTSGMTIRSGVSNMRLRDNHCDDAIVNASATTDYGVLEGAGTPEGVVTATVGAMYRRKDGGAGTTLYIKESGTGNTGWVAK